MTVATVEGRNYNPTRASVFNDPAVQATMGEWANGTYLPVVLANLDGYAEIGWPPQPESAFLATRWDQALQEIWAGDDAQTALDSRQGGHRRAHAGARADQQANERSRGTGRKMRPVSRRPGTGD